MIKNVIVLHILFIGIITTSLNSCSSDNSDIDLSGIDLNLEVIRFEQALFNSRSLDELIALKERYPYFYDVYLNNIMPQSMAMMNMSDTDKAVELYRYVSHPDMDSLYQLSQHKFEDFDEYAQELELAAKRINYYFPEEKIEKLISFVSSFEYGSVFLEDTKAFAVGLDMYMGRNFEVYPLLDPSRFPSYRVNKFEPYYLVPNAVKSFLYYKAKMGSGNSFIDEAVYEGKILYAMDKLLPNTADSLKIAYAKGQLEWSNANAENIWAYLVEKDILFSSDKNEYTNKFFNDGPFTTPFGNESAPRAGAWVGWQIVKEYMSRNEQISLQELLADTDHQKIFKESSYKP